jgi:hypothetical protein
MIPVEAESSALTRGTKLNIVPKRSIQKIAMTYGPAHLQIFGIPLPCVFKV